ncbi:MAG: inositol monophosphatase family protein [Lactobacillales bacterium]|jgi:myo-inositol-1(or 4)-monophosphatase|nr:inositol monophosphatase family protein [Lactobacillales bacterium]
MEEEKSKALVELIYSWIQEAGSRIRSHLNEELTVSTKNGRDDIVTNVDKETQEFLIRKILEKFPEDKILAEENGLDRCLDMSGRVWIIDPIDGTLNFYFQRENFAVMLALYVDGIGKLGFIYNVMREELYWGGAEFGVYCNQTKLSAPKEPRLEDGLFGMNSAMYVQNTLHAHDIGIRTMGVRTSGCAGLEFISLLKGNTIGYISNLSPWDYAAGVVLSHEFGFISSQLNGCPLSFDGREYFLIATSPAYEEIKGKYIS